MYCAMLTPFNIYLAVTGLQTSWYIGKGFDHPGIHLGKHMVDFHPRNITTFLFPFICSNLFTVNDEILGLPCSNL